jgi:formylglycine-generating enzyme required for sulfatase activity
MHGNATEWCHNLYSPQAGQTDDAVRNNDGRLLRGGSFLGHTSVVRSAFRNFYQLSDRLYNIGFRPSKTCNLSP